jgi:hypothetical protein
MLQMDCPGVIVRLVYLYHRVGLDSVGVGGILHLKSPHIRQLLWRLWAVADKYYPEFATRGKKRRPPEIDEPTCQRITRMLSAGNTLIEVSDHLRVSVPQLKYAFGFYGMELPTKAGHHERQLSNPATA